MENGERVSVLEEIISCGTKNCDSNGACPVNGRVEANVKDMINPNICICDEPYEGISCMENGERVNVAALEGTTATGAYDAQNAIDNKKDTHTRDTKYLEVELRELTKIERIVIWTSNSISSNAFNLCQFPQFHLQIFSVSSMCVFLIINGVLSVVCTSCSSAFQSSNIAPFTILHAADTFIRLITNANVWINHVLDMCFNTTR